MKKMRKNLLIAVLVASLVFVVIGLTGQITTFAASTVNLGTADNFAVLGGSTVTNTGSSVVTGDLGVSPGAAITGFPPGTVVSGAIYAADATALQAQNDLATAYGNAASQACTQDLTGQDLGGLTLTPGVYCFDTSAQLTGTLTLNGQNDPSAVFIFKIGSTLTTASNSNISLINSAQVCRVFWQVGSSATLGTSTNFKGNILALTSITLNTSANVEGRVLARNGAVTLDTNNITKAVCTTSLHLRKTITNDNGGTALNTAWTLTATGAGGSPTNLTGNTPVDSGAIFNADTYTLSESGGPSGYTAGTYSCVKNGGGAVINNSITLATGDDATCTINNNDNAAHLIVIKHVINDNSGSALASAFSTTITGVTTAVPTAAGVESPGVDNILTTVGAYSIDEGAHVGYNKTLSADCSGTIALGETKTCTITNDDIAPQSLHLRKIVINDNGGTALNTAWTLTATGAGGSPTNLTGNTPVDSGAIFNADTYTLSESGGPSGYLASSWVCVGGTQSGSTITIASGENATCTITNDDVAPRLTVTKIVTNDNIGTKVISNFPLFIDGFSVISGIASTTSIGSHTVSETSSSGYTSSISGDCIANGTITLALGEVKFCIITNDDIPMVSSVVGGGSSSYTSNTPPVPPLIDLVKIPSPLALPAGPGPVTYTYTLRNIGTVPVTNITLVGDTCSPIVLASGDTNTDNKLDVNETWVHRCSTTLSKTHTNTVVATGWANGISATDIASATVVVGLPVVPPLIHVTKIPSPLTLLAKGGSVTYTEKITNPGTVALRNVSLTDDKCSPMKYISGDKNKDSKLDTTETWTYTCRTNLSKTTTNTAIAEGFANGLSVRDFAIATVVVAGVVPKLPNTGIALEDNNIPWNIIILAGTLLLISASLAIILKKRAN